MQITMFEFIQFYLYSIEFCLQLLVNFIFSCEAAYRTIKRLTFQVSRSGQINIQDVINHTFFQDLFLALILFCLLVLSFTSVNTSGSDVLPIPREYPSV